MKLYAVFAPGLEWMDVSHVNSFFRSTAKEYLVECHHIFHERITENERHTFEHTSYSFHMKQISGQCFTVVTDTEYPTRTAFLLIRHLRQDQIEHVDSFIQSFQRPYELDCIAKIQHELDETMVIMHRNIDTILERGEKLDELIEKSERLSASSKAFYKTAKKANRCCILL